jgi:hypothetical protein
MRWLRRIAEALLALVILFEEWGWEPLQRVLARLARWPVLAALERRIAGLSPWPALALFGVPALALLPLKLLALWLIGRQHALLGLLLIVGAKLVGTAIVARLFTLTKPALLRLRWFAAFYPRWLGWKQVVVDRVRASWAWRAGRVMRERLRRRWRRWRGRA